MSHPLELEKCLKALRKSAACDRFQIKLTSMARGEDSILTWIYLSRDAQEVIVRVIDADLSLKLHEARKREARHMRNQAAELLAEAEEYER